MSCTIRVHELDVPKANCCVFVSVCEYRSENEQLGFYAETGTDCTVFYALDILHPVVGFTTATVAFTDREINRGPNTVGLRRNLVLQLGLHPVYRATFVRGVINDTENHIHTNDKACKCI
jgi:hypothetical protein